MTIWKGRAKQKETGGRYRALRKKRKTELSQDARPASVGKTELRKSVRRRGGESKTKLVKALYANISGKDKTKKVKILDVLENKANRHFARRKVVTKGALIKTEAGEAVVTSRPTQDGVVNARLK